ncbi:ABC transporter ATP-binding protein [Nonomuraea sp. NPDC050394]|uniref:ABC transporter ATP-binding protein n=1 Tax=Nonomuraea sp. NPDC050394 TaxID=3364363 RepID=UPI0037AF1AA6
MKGLIRLLLSAGPVRTPLLGLVLLVKAGLATGYMFAVGALVSAIADGGPRDLVGPLVVLGALMLAQDLAGPAQTMLAGDLTRAVTRKTTGTIVRAALTAGVARMENPEVADHFSLAQGRAPGALPVGPAVGALAQLGATRLTGLAAALTLASYAWWAPLPLAAAWMLTGRWVDREVRGAVAGFAASTASLRRATYFRNLGLLPAGAKELRVFGLGPWLVRRFAAAWAEGMREVLAFRQPRSAFAARLAVLAGAHVVTLSALAVAGLDVGGLTVAVQAVFGTAALGYAGDPQWTLATAGSALPHIEHVRELATARPRGGGSASGMPAREIRFEGAGFAYPGAGRNVLDGLDLTVPAGGSLALVGGNGAGKTTLLKLLAGLYEPGQGRILIDGTDLATIDPDSWRRQLAVVFQDFCRFEATLRDNVSFGAVHRPPDDDAVLDALRLAGAGDLPGRLPYGLGTIMSRQYEGGGELSGGQWQKVALARAIYAVGHGARVLILDEPTAHLDVRAESRLYERFLELTSGVTTILVSHRFSTVRMADRIAVLEGGRVAELGDHAGLVRAGGVYARSYALHAGRFRREAADA